MVRGRAIYGIISLHTREKGVIQTLWHAKYSYLQVPRQPVRAPGSPRIPNLQNLTHSWDAERRKCGYITYTLDNQPALALSQNTSAESKAIRRVNDCVEENMRHGNTVFIDNMNVLLRNMKTFLEFARKYCYTAYLVDFQGELTLDELYTRNRTREYTKRVPEEVIETAYNNHRELRENWRSILKNYRDVVAGYIAPGQVFTELFTPVRALDNYHKVVVVGDIQGMGGMGMY